MLLVSNWSQLSYVEHRNRASNILNQYNRKVLRSSADNTATSQSVPDGTQFNINSIRIDLELVSECSWCGGDKCCPVTRTFLETGDISRTSCADSAVSSSSRGDSALGPLALPHPPTPAAELWIHNQNNTDINEYRRDNNMLKILQMHWFFSIDFLY